MIQGSQNGGNEGQPGFVGLYLVCPEVAVSSTPSKSELP